MRQNSRAQSELTGKYYVYTLAYPDGTVFYVGKGQGNRIDQHEIEARKGVKSHKCNTIRKIWSTDCKVLKTKVAFFETDKEALEFEVHLIAFFGMENLTNLTTGGEGASTPTRNRVSVVLSISDEKPARLLSWLIGELQAQGIENPSDQEISQLVKTICYKHLAALQASGKRISDTM